MALQSLMESQGWQILNNYLADERQVLYGKITMGKKPTDRLSAADRLGEIDRLLKLPESIMGTMVRDTDDIHVDFQGE